VVVIVEEKLRLGKGGKGGNFTTEDTEGTEEEKKRISPQR
jgi:hypothetical protein